MRFKTLLPVLALAILATFLLYVRTGHQPPSSPVNQVISPSANESSSPAATRAQAENPEHPSAGDAANAATSPSAQQSGAADSPEARHLKYVATRIAELQDLAMDDDTNSLNNILADLTNPEAEIRKAALEATIQFASRDAIPALTLAGQQLDDPREKVAIQDAIEFLKLPRLTETNRPTHTPLAPR